MMSNILKGLKPELVFKYFEEISNIPRGSGNEKAISDYLVSFAKERNLEYVQDDVLNVIIRKPATKGYENSKGVIIQGHMDMVCEKNNGTNHDFEKDPLKLVVEGDYIKATGTTLGADNGIAMAYGLAVLDSNDLQHPPLEVLMTTEEETGMTGAIGLKAEDIKGEILLNIDSEDEGTLLVSCAGGIRAKVSLKTEWEETTSFMENAIITIRGLKGGHSGMDIIKGRGNANKIMGRILIDLLKVSDYRIADLKGGSKNNAIPRECDALICVNGDKKGIIKEKIATWNKILKNEFASIDEGLKVEVTFESEVAKKVLTKDCTEKAVKLLYMMPNGIETMSKQIENLVQSSNNLGVVTLKENVIDYDNALRSSIKSLKVDILEKIELVAEAYGAEVIKESDYPEWQYEEISEARDICSKVYEDMYGIVPEIVAIHAGVECGLFKEKLPHLDMISFGPNLYDVHTPEEKMSISSVAKYFDYIVEILKRLK